MDNLILFILGAAFGGVIEMLVQTPFEELVSKRFQQILHTGVYRKLYFQTVDFEQLKKKLIESVDNYDFDYVRILVKQMEWFIEEKTAREKRTARETARKDFRKDISLINKFKGNKNPAKYVEPHNKWEQNGS